MGRFFAVRSSTQAKIVRRNRATCLLVSFGASNPPLLWQHDLEKMSGHTISLNQKDGEWSLGLDSPGGTFTPVAHFDERPSAEEAYVAVSRALIRDAAKGQKWGWGRRLFALLLFLLLSFFAVSLLLPPVPSGVRTAAREESQAVRQEAPARPPERQEIQNGVPMNADNVLEPPAP